MDKRISTLIGAWRPFPLSDSIPYAFAGLNELLIGMRPGQLIVIGARPGIGKSSFVISQMLALENHSVVFFSLEMTWQAVIGRMICYSLGISHDTLSEHQELYAIKVNQIKQQLASQKFIIDDSPLLNPNLLVEKIRVYTNILGVKPQLVVIDYLQIMQRNIGAVSDMVQSYLDICRSIRETAKSFGIPIMVLAQLKRPDSNTVNKHGPRMHDLFGGSGIEQTADVIILLYRPTVETDDDAKFCVVKNREGRTGNVPIQWNNTIGKWEDLA